MKGAPSEAASEAAAEESALLAEPSPETEAEDAGGNSQQEFYADVAIFCRFSVPAACLLEKCNMQYQRPASHTSLDAPHYISI